MTAPANLRFVQFPHPGDEHHPDLSGFKQWHRAEKQHGRKFLSLDGRWRDGKSEHMGKLWAWAEWEPESRVLQRLHQPSDECPRWLWEPYYEPKASYQGLHNTDPFIFGGFFYTNCRQKQTGSGLGLKQLGPGSVVLFGSKRPSGWVVDTVLVVRDFVDHDANSFKRALMGSTPACYEEVVLRPTYANANPDGASFRFYRGATIADPVDGMFSFFPCIPARGMSGFPRPAIGLPEAHFTPNLSRSAKGHAIGVVDVKPRVIRDLWTSVAVQVLEQGLVLGTYAKPPRRHATPD